MPRRKQFKSKIKGGTQKEMVTELLGCVEYSTNGSTNFLCFPTATRMRLQPPCFLGYNLKEAPTPIFSGYNQKEATTPYVLRLQPEGGYNHLSLLRPTALK
jgi:hypothetical protein